MDIYLIMGWRDPRLVNSFDKPILVKEEDILEKIWQVSPIHPFPFPTQLKKFIFWRPDPFFDAKEAEFHEVTFLNFLLRIFNDGLILYETRLGGGGDCAINFCFPFAPFLRIKLKPACNLILCKYPHDKQTCELQIKSCESISISLQPPTNPFAL